MNQFWIIPKLLVVCFLLPSICYSQDSNVHVVVQSSLESIAFNMDGIEPPAVDDDAASAKWSIVSGKQDPNSGPISALSDGKIPSDEDQPAENFFFNAGSAGGCIAVDFGSVLDIQQVVTYSWHADSRAPQIYTLYGSDGVMPEFNLSKFREEDAKDLGWIRVAHVDSTSKTRGGQHAAAISGRDGSLGKYRYLLFDIERTEQRDAFGNTFFSEIDVLRAGRPKVSRIEVPESSVVGFESTDGRYRYSIDTTLAPDLAQWSEEKLKPVILEWYPKIVDLLPSESFQAATHVRFRYLPENKMKGIPAYAQGATISMNAGWFRKELNREARGSVVHEMVHVVQSYRNRGRRGPNSGAAPGWLVEGIPDYIRWFLYEPQSKGALLSKPQLAQAKHDASYRVSANFIDWVIRTYGAQGDLLQSLNQAAREGKYSSEFWKEHTGKSEEELENEWRGN